MGALSSGWGFCCLMWLTWREQNKRTFHGVENSDRMSYFFGLLCIVEAWDLGKVLPSLDQNFDFVDSFHTLLL